MEGQKPEWHRKVGGRAEAGNQLQNMITEKTKNAVQEAEAFSHAHPELAAKFTQYLEEVDIGTLQSIFSEIARKSGVDPAILNMPSKDSILFTHGAAAHGAMAMYSSIDNLMRVYPTRVLESGEIAGLLDTEVKAMFTHALIHEYTHATAKTVALYEQTQHSDVFYSQSGLNVRSTDVQHPAEGGQIVDHVSLYSIFNEGITEHIAVQVGDEYIRRVGIPGMSQSEAVEARQTYLRARMDDTDDYGAAIHFVDNLVAAISRDTGVPEDIVFRGFVRSYYRGDLLHEAHTQELLDETLGHEFTETLAASSNATDLRHARERFDKLAFLHDGSGRKWLTRLGISGGTS